eukprot:Nitzschia sp. Nitz4//scaffold59_size112058//7004//9634//NITZ4_004096-RA/size112058-processed-gene-0.178-mRNA-1//1//CDS//3329555084//8817//frame0
MTELRRDPIVHKRLVYVDLDEDLEDPGDDLFMDVGFSQLPGLCMTTAKGEVFDDPVSVGLCSTNTAQVVTRASQCNPYELNEIATTKWPPRRPYEFSPSMDSEDTGKYRRQTEGFNYAKALLHSEQELEKLAYKIRSEIHQSEMFALAVEAERAANAGLQSFSAKPTTTFGSEFPLDPSHSIPIRRNQTFTEGSIPTHPVEHTRIFRPFKLRNIDDVVPRFQELHSQMRTHMFREKVSEPSLIFHESPVDDDMEPKASVPRTTSDISRSLQVIGNTLASHLSPSNPCARETTGYVHCGVPQSSSIIDPSGEDPPQDLVYTPLEPLVEPSDEPLQGFSERRAHTPPAQAALMDMLDDEGGDHCVCESPIRSCPSHDSEDRAVETPLGMTKSGRNQFATPAGLRDISHRKRLSTPQGTDGVQPFEPSSIVDTGEPDPSDRQTTTSFGQKETEFLALPSINDGSTTRTTNRVQHEELTNAHEGKRHVLSNRFVRSRNGLQPRVPTDNSPRTVSLPELPGQGSESTAEIEPPLIHRMERSEQVAAFAQGGQLAPTFTPRVGFARDENRDESANDSIVDDMEEECEIMADNELSLTQKAPWETGFIGGYGAGHRNKPELHSAMSTVNERMGDSSFRGFDILRNALNFRRTSSWPRLNTGSPKRHPELSMGGHDRVRSGIRNMMMHPMNHDMITTDWEVAENHDICHTFTSPDDTFQMAVEEVISRLSPTQRCHGKNLPYISAEENREFLSNYFYCTKPQRRIRPMRYDYTDNICTAPCTFNESLCHNIGVDTLVNNFQSLMEKQDNKDSNDDNLAEEESPTRKRAFSLDTSNFPNPSFQDWLEAVGRSIDHVGSQFWEPKGAQADSVEFDPPCLKKAVHRI